MSLAQESQAADYKETRKLEIDKKLDVSYCIPLWLRDEQMAVNIANVKGRLEPQYDKRTDEIAIVCFGPSLNDTWEEIKHFKYIMTTSGAHKFLLERGIVPTWQVEVDPRKHKLALLGTPHPNVEYLIASTCHPDYFAALNGFNVKLWHVFDPGDEAIRHLPQGEWALTGGCSAGLRALTVARFLGFRNMHIFGMDGSSGASGKHAAEHPSQAKQSFDTSYNGVTYQTTPGFLEAAKQTWHELDQMGDIVATFYGEGLVQAMAKDYVPKGRKGEIIAVQKEVCTTDEYRQLNTQLHKDKLEYGVGGGKHANTVIKLAESIKSHSILDYGCGKGYLAKAIPFPIWEYDPAIPTKATPPRAADLVVCTDVLEHIEPECLEAVLIDLHRVVLKIGYFIINTGPARKTYADGRNTHLLQEGRAWWEKRLSKYFKIGKIIEQGPLLIVLVGRKDAIKKKKKVV